MMDTKTTGCTASGTQMYNWSFRLTAAFLVAVLFFGVFFTGCGIADADIQESEGVQATAVPALLPALAGDIAQVLPMGSGIVAVLYTDGTVGVAGDIALAEKTASWNNIERLYEDSDYDDGYVCHLTGLRTDGTAVSTRFDLSGWSNLKELHCAWNGTVGVTNHGEVVSVGEFEENLDPAGWTDIRSVTPSDFGLWYGVKSDGTVVVTDPCDSDVYLTWKNVVRLQATTHDIHAFLEDGSVINGLSEDTSGLRGAVKTVDFNDWLFGLTSDGQLLTENGELYAYGGIFSMDPSIGIYNPETEVDISHCKNIKDFMMCGSLIMLKYDGTVDAINCYAMWDFSGWENITSICACTDADWVSRIYGVREDGSVVVQMDEQNPVELDNYLGWRVCELFSGHNGVVGITADGRLTGDCGYAQTDFTVLER